MVVFLMPMFIILLVTIFYSVYRVRKGTTFFQGMIRVLLLDFILFLIAVVWWFIYIKDGFSQLFGAGYYGLAFIIVGIINAVILYIYKK
jgi:hypothetical protein